MANVGVGVLQGMPVSTSLSASSLNEASGARTEMSSLVTGGLVIGTLLILAPLFSDLPKAVLGAVIIDAVVFGMIDLAELRRLYRVTRFDFWIAVAAIIGVLSAGVLAGVVIGVVLSLGWLVYVATRPPMPLLGREPGTQVFRDLVENPDDETIAGIAVVRLDGGLFFATAEALEDRVRELTDDGSRAVVLDLEGVNFVDSQGSAKVAEIHELTRASTSRCAWLASNRRSGRCSSPTGSSSSSAPTTSTAMFTVRSRPNWPRAAQLRPERRASTEAPGRCPTRHSASGFRYASVWRRRTR